MPTKQAYLIEPLNGAPKPRITVGQHLDGILDAVRLAKAAAYLDAASVLSYDASRGHSAPMIAQKLRSRAERVG